MEPTRAAQIINSIPGRPGYTLQASEYSPLPNSIVLRVMLDTVDTSYPPNYPHRLNAAGTVDIIDTHNLHSTADVLYAVHKTVMEVESHEWREFLAVPDGRGGFEMPLHPHTMPGQVAWSIARQNG